jgi:WD40 repeat protein
MRFVLTNVIESSGDGVFPSALIPSPARSSLDWARMISAAAPTAKADQRQATAATWTGKVVLKKRNDSDEVVLEGHVEQVDHLSFSHDGHLLVTKAQDQRVIIWRVETGKRVLELDEQVTFLGGGADFHPQTHLLAPLSDSPGSIRI